MTSNPYWYYVLANSYMWKKLQGHFLGVKWEKVLFCGTEWEYVPSN